MNWHIKYMYGMWVAVSMFDYTIWAKTERELNALFNNTGYFLNEG